MAFPPRLLIVTDDVSGGGTAQVAYQLAFTLRTVFKVHFACQRNNTTTSVLDEFEREGIVVHSYDVTEATAWQRPWQSVYSVYQAADLIDASCPDVILTVDAAELISFSALKSASKRSGIPFVAVINVLLDDKKSRFGDLFDVRIAILAGAEALVFACAAHLRRFEAMLPNFPVPRSVILNSRPDAFFEPRNLDARKRLRNELDVNDDDTLVCLTTARIEPHKGHIRILKALALLNERGRGAGIRLIFAGTGQSAHVYELKNDIVRHGLESHVSVLGSRTDIIDLLDASDVFILPSKSEATSLAIIEALAKGIPVVATGVDGILELIDETTGILLPVDEDASVCALAHAIDRLKSDPSFRSRLGDAGRKKADQFRVQPTVARYKDLLINILRRRPRTDSRRSFASSLLPVGSAIDFANPEQVWNFLQSGWSISELDGIWTSGAVSTLVLKTNARKGQTLRLVIELAPHLGPAWPSQETDVFVDDRLVVSWRLTLPGRQALSLVLKVTDKTGTLDIRLVHHRAVSPLTLGLTEDPRNLALFFHRIEILPA